VRDLGLPTRIAAYAPSGAAIPVHASPILLPDGRHFLYAIGHYGPTDAAYPDGIFVASLLSTATSRLIRAPLTTLALALVDGQLLYTRGRTLVTQPFDTRVLTLTGEPTTLAEAACSVRVRRRDLERRVYLATVKHSAAHVVAGPDAMFGKPLSAD